MQADFIRPASLPQLSSAPLSVCLPIFCNFKTGILMIIVQSLSVVPCFGEFQVHFAPDQSDLMTSPSMKVSCSSGSIIEKTLQIRSKGEAHLIHVITTSNSIFFQGEKMRRMKNINWFAEGAGRGGKHCTRAKCGTKQTVPEPYSSKIKYNCTVY